MFSKFKTITLAVITAAATMIGSGQAWALDAPPTSRPSFERGLGCTGAVVVGAAITYSAQGQGQSGVLGVGQFTYFPGSVSYDPLRAYRYNASDQTLWAAAVAAGCPLDEIVVERFERPDNADVPGEGTAAAAAAYAAISYIGVVFTARDTTDGLYYRHEWAVSDQTNTQVINTRVQIPPP